MILQVHLFNTRRIFYNNGKAKINTRSLIANCLRVSKGSLLIRLHMTKTIALCIAVSKVHINFADISRLFKSPFFISSFIKRRGNH